MPSYRPPISRDEFHYLEVYYFKLVMFTNEIEFKVLKGDDQEKIWREINYMELILSIMRQVFVKPDKIERPVVGWRIDGDDEFLQIFKFSCIKVAAEALNCDASKISAVCKAKRSFTSAPGHRNAKTGEITRYKYTFQYEDEYSENQPLTFHPDSSEFKFV